MGGGGSREDCLFLKSGDGIPMAEIGTIEGVGMSTVATSIPIGALA
jgi:hypothetical protein